MFYFNSILKKLDVIYDASYKDRELMNPFFGVKSSREAKAAYICSIQDQGDYKNMNVSLGTNTTRIMYTDPKLLVFTLARHKYVAKMLDGFKNVLEIGCQEGFGSVIVAQAVGHMVAIDFYKPYIDSCLRRLGKVAPNIEFRGHDIIDGPVVNQNQFDGAFALDVLEHISKSDESIFMSNICLSLSDKGVLIIGTPSLESQSYASKSSKVGHINCKSGDCLHEFCDAYFHNVFMFGMNDEVLHTGFFKMSHYLFALCVNPVR